ncbi:T9SS type A sorting domain-containing protein [Flavobacterium amnicola]|uniref:T9SS type A sorting domain-containing protein n=1 Tax=Flavobacterium amnicola TaxID=2506422 RepID=A0A4Q1K494_9FLAO|nr:T9SS type A sorting domain-containing protein [Flavobacterium amnicola]RXR19241.1 T9SS type A sorting domain-containing protein [Flavobacterium amnicola]
MKKKYLLPILFFVNIIFSQNNLSVSIIPPVPICSAGECADLVANYVNIKSTNDYLVQSIPHGTNFPYTGGVLLDNSSDDVWSTVFDLPFNFCFYGNTYNQVLIGSNGLVHFPDGTQTQNGFCQWSFNSTIPNAAFPVKNAIYGVYQDTDIRTPPITSPSNQNVNYYIVGVSPDRRVVINFNELPQYSCAASVGLQTSQIILYETTNVIEINIKNRTSCTTWNGGRGLVGLQNQTGTIAHTPANRNTGVWSANNESWRFTPNGNSVANFEWSKNGVFYSSANPINVCPDNGDVFEAKVTYTNCDGTEVVLSDTQVLNVEPQITGIPQNISACVLEVESTATFDLRSNENDYGINTEDYDFYYFASLSDANNNVHINNPTSFVSSGQTIYVGIESFYTGCYVLKNYDLIIEHGPSSPTGSTTQFFTPGQTLENLVVNGQNIVWFDAATNGNVLPISTPLVNNTTYYAASSTSSGCLSGRLAPGRLGVLVQETLHVDGFNKDSFKTFPNPVKNIFKVSYIKNISNVSVTNLVGQEVLSKKVNALQTDVDMSALSSGTYLVKVTSEGLTKTIKVIKE